MIYTFVIISIYLISGCETGVENSPSAGILRITLQSDPADTMLVERSDTFTVNQRYTALFMLKIFQGRVYQEKNFAVLYRTTTSYRQEDALYNILAMDSLGDYKQYTIFESLIPPGNYTSLEFGVNAASDYKLTIVALSGKVFQNPVELPPGEKLLVSFPQDFKVDENRVTQIDVQISPFKSITRYRDVYRFYRKMKITGVHYF
ncbi:MAG: hypothetical protein A2V93_08000 [Ignavibacteria bacterium RBG_16_34_14]|nr:MAG: hypothetical protein A2V93_08000 [Ignavibacteria bacterium RBG_16_34_14]